MRSTTRFFGLGLVIGVSFTALLMGLIVMLGRSGSGQASPTATVSPTIEDTTLTSTPTAESSSTPTAAEPTFTAIPTLGLQAQITSGTDQASTPTPDPIISALNAGDLVFSGPLPVVEQISLYRASVNYARQNATDSIRVSKEINGVGYGDPTNICGPLAIAILRDAGVIANDIVPHDFWLLNPVATTDQRLLAKAFPPDRFSHAKVITPLNKVDWRTTPLQPGDFLFIWHGSGGNFDHMLVVSRVDRDQRAYAVTNFGTTNGFIIAETLLYDPRDPKAGIFHTWTKERDAILGSTGFGGYEIWRALGPSAWLISAPSLSTPRALASVAAGL